MSSTMMMLGVTLKLFDQMSGGMRNIAGSVEGLRGKLKSLSNAAGELGRSGIANGLIAGGAVMKTVSAFSQLEDASTRLKVTMMDRNGMTGAFEKVNALAVKLGNELPGTSADFLNMMATLKQFGTSDESILAGVGEATAKMAVLLKQTPEQAAEFAAKLKEATGVADGDMLKFMDTIQRVYHQGVSATEMMYAFARSAGALKQVKIQGLEASREMSALYAILIKTGMSGETVGTGMGAIINTLMDTKKIREANDLLKQKGFKTLEFTDKKGNFLGVKNMVEQFEKLKALNPAQLAFILKKIFGGGQDQQMVATLIENGMDGYRKMVGDMEKQADLQKRVGLQLGTLKNLWDAASGTFTNTLAGFAEAMGDDLKALTKLFGDLSEKLGAFFKENPQLTRWLGLTALGFVALTLVGGSLLLTFAGIARVVTFVWPVFGQLATVLGWLATALRVVGTVMMFVGRALLLNPIGLAVTAIATAALLIYKYWEPISDFFSNLWAGVVARFESAWETIKAGIASLVSWLPDWLRPGGSPAVNLAQAAPSPGAARPGAVGQRGAEVGGEILVRVDQDGRVKTVQAQSRNSAVPFNVDAGPAMVMP